MYSPDSKKARIRFTKTRNWESVKCPLLPPASVYSCNKKKNEKVRKHCMLFPKHTFLFRNCTCNAPES